MALHILNFSINPPDALDQNVSKDLSYNEIESITEWVFEDVLQIKNAFPEKDDHNQDNSYFIKKVASIYFCEISAAPFQKIKPTISGLKTGEIIVYNEPCHTQHYFKVFSPPPEA